MKRILLFLLLLHLPHASARASCGPDVEVAGSAEGCIAVAVLGEAHGDTAVVGIGRATGERAIAGIGSTDALVGLVVYGCNEGDIGVEVIPACGAPGGA